MWFNDYEAKLSFPVMYICAHVSLECLQMSFNRVKVMRLDRWAKHIMRLTLS